MNSRQNGQALEDTLDLQHAQYRRDRKALCWHNGVQSIHRRAEIIQVLSLPDYGFILTQHGGRGGMFDAKFTQDERLRYRHPTDRKHQLIQLWDVHQAGGIAFLLVSYRLLKHWVVWPDASWEHGGPFAITLRDGEYARWEATEIPDSDGNGLPDWISVIERVEA